MTPGEWHVLVVDDNEMNRDVLSRRLERQGYTVSLAEDGERALELARKQPFDLMLLDIMMPKLNGYQVLEQLKSDPALRRLPVIVISAVDELDSVVKCIELGAEDYLFKPFNPVLLKARVSATLEKKRLYDTLSDSGMLTLLDDLQGPVGDLLDQAQQLATSAGTAPGLAQQILDNAQRIAERISRVSQNTP